MPEEKIHPAAIVGIGLTLTGIVAGVIYVSTRITPPLEPADIEEQLRILYAKLQQVQELLAEATSPEEITALQETIKALLAAITELEVALETGEMPPPEPTLIDIKLPETVARGSYFEVETTWYVTNPWAGVPPSYSVNVSAGDRFGQLRTRLEGYMDKGVIQSGQALNPTQGYHTYRSQAVAGIYKAYASDGRYSTIFGMTLAEWLAQEVAAGRLIPTGIGIEGKQVYIVPAPPGVYTVTAWMRVSRLVSPIETTEFVRSPYVDLGIRDVTTGAPQKDYNFGVVAELKVV